MENDYQYQTKEYDSQSGLVYFGARYYDPSIGRFTTADPLGMVDGPNQYVYLNNNPIGFIDAWGLCNGSGASGNWIDDPPLEEDFLFMDVFFDGVDLVALYSDPDLSLGEKAIWTPLIIGPC